MERYIFDTLIKNKGELRESGEQMVDLNSILRLLNNVVNRFRKLDVDSLSRQGGLNKNGLHKNIKKKKDFIKDKLVNEDAKKDQGNNNKLSHRSLSSEDNKFVSKDNEVVEHSKFV